MSRYNFETLELPKESVKGWAETIRVNRCNDPDINFYAVEVNFDAIREETDVE